jgi:hypothetical protein
LIASLSSCNRDISLRTIGCLALLSQSPAGAARLFSGGTFSAVEVSLVLTDGELS